MPRTSTTILRPVAERVLKHPLAFQAFQTIIGAPDCHRRFLKEHVHPRPDEAVLDLGCGTGNSLKYLPAGIRYVGVDIDADYVTFAKQCYADRGTFKVADATMLSNEWGRSFDKAFSFGVLHHLPDELARRLVDNAVRALKPGGTFLSIDPCFAEGQSRIAKFLVSNDRGRHVRDQAHYRAIFEGWTTEYILVVSDMLRIPYTQIIAKIRA